MTLVELDLSSVSEVLTNLLDATAPGTRWFRGVGCSTFHLQPSLYRRLESPTPQQILSVEERLILRFRQRSLPWWPEGYPQTDWEHLFAMQHYGVPTRLLDWSENALAGLYFASDHDPKVCPCGSGACVPVLWILDPLRLNSRNPRRDGMEPVILTSGNATEWEPNVQSSRFAPMPVALYGTHNSVRIAAQQGTFTVAGKETTPLDETALGKEDGVLQRVKLRITHEELANALRLLGVTRASVYPGLEGVALDIAREEVF